MSCVQQNKFYLSKVIRIQNLHFYSFIQTDMEKTENKSFQICKSKDLWIAKEKISVRILENVIKITRFFSEICAFLLVYLECTWLIYLLIKTEILKLKINFSIV